MTELALDLTRALHHVDTDMDVDRTDNVWKGLVVKRRRRVVRRVAGAAALVLLVGGVAFLRGGGRDDSFAVDSTVAPAPQPDRQQPPDDDGTIRLADGSTILPEGAITKIDVVHDAATNIAVRVNEGKGRFQVDARADRKFRVTTDRVRITVYAAEFSVAHADKRTMVYVERGYLDIEYDGPVGKLSRRVNSGESALFPPEMTAGVEPDKPAPDAVVRPRAKHPARTRAQRRLAVSDLMRKADAARGEGRPADAIKPLTRIVRRFSSDPRAAMASFTLGRIYLQKLDQPRTAARAFRRAQLLAPGGPLAEDALAREVESWANAGQSNNARSRAKLYLKRYPNGHRARAMKKYAE